MSATKGKIQTVRGLINPDELGITLTHEHILFDSTDPINEPNSEKERKWRNQDLGASRRKVFNEPVSLDNIGLIYHHGWKNKDNGRLGDINTAVEEVNVYKALGGKSLVEATSIGIKRDAEGLLKVSNLTDTHIIMGGSFYVHQYHPKWVTQNTSEDLAEIIINDITMGVDGRNIKTGIIGEVGCSHPLHPEEEKTLIASAIAQKETGCPILIHPGRDEHAPLIAIDILEKAGADLKNVIMGHLDRTVFEKDTLKRIGEKGCFFEWDLFGREKAYYPANELIDMPSDAKRIADILWLANEGYSSKILIAHDVCTKVQTLKYGGWGFSYILSFIVPRMLQRGYNQDLINKILISNPAQALAFTK